MKKHENGIIARSVRLEKYPILCSKELNAMEFKALNKKNNSLNCSDNALNERQRAK